MRIMAGRALHSAGKERNVAVSVDGVEVGRRLNADGCRGRRIRISEVDWVLFGQVPHGHVLTHEERSLRNRFEGLIELAFIPGIDGHGPIMAA